MWLLSVSLFVVGCVLVARLCAGWLVSLVCARLFRCQQVKIGRFGVFSLSHLKLVICDGLSVELESLRLKSSLVNQDYTKPLVLKVGDVRVDASHEALAWFSSKGTATKQQQQQPDNTKQRKLLRALNWLQYMAVQMSTGQVVVMDAPAAGTILHVALENASFDTYRDHSLLNLELASSMINCKLLRRSQPTAADSPPKQPAPHLLNSNINLFILLGVDFRSAKLTKVETKLSNPMITVHEGFIWYARSQALARKLRPSDDDENGSAVVASPANVELNRLFELGAKCVCESLSMQFVATDGRSSELTVRGLDAHSQNESGTIELAMMDIYLTDQCGSTAQVSALTCALTREFLGNEQLMFQCHPKQVGEPVGWMCALHVDEPVCSVTQPDVTWWCSFLRHIYDEWPRGPPPTTTAPAGTASVSRLQQLNLEVSSLCLVFVPNDNQHRIQLIVALVSIVSNQQLNEFECGLESVCCCQVQDRTVADKCSYSTHAWGTPLLCAAALFKMHRSAVSRICRVNGRIEDLRLEWDIQLVTQLVTLATSLSAGLALRRSPSPPPSAGKAPPTTTSDTARPLLVLQLLFSQVSLIAPVKAQVYVHVHAKELRLGRDKSATSVRAVGIGAQYGCVKQRTIAFETDGRPVGYEIGLADAGLVVFEQLLDSGDAVLECRSASTLVWCPEAHMAVHTVLDASRAQLRRVATSPDEVPVAADAGPVRTPRLAFGTEHPITVRLHVSPEHTLQFTVPQLQAIRDVTVSSVSTAQLCVAFDGHDVLTLTNFVHEQTLTHAKCVEVRQADPSLQLPFNRVWTFTADMLRLWFPFRYNFAEAYDSTVNCFKWLKLVHAIKKRAFTLASRLPPDLYFMFKQIVMVLDDDPFEVRLRNNFELLYDEHVECEKRLKVLQERLLIIQRTNPLLPNSKIAEMYEALKAKNSSIYIQRCQQMQPVRTALFEWKMEHFEFKVLADSSLHGTDNCVRLMQQYNTETNLPPNITFSTLWARAIELDVSAFSMHFRDYNQPYMLIDDAHFWGKIVGAEATPAERTQRECRMHLRAPWQSVDVHRNINPLKFYYDLNSDMARWTITYGPCWEPCLSMINMCWNRVSPPSKDPSPPLPYFDKVRQRWHGRLSMACSKLVTAMLASIDPYNDTEQLEITWNNFRWDWTSGLFLIQSDLDAFVRTASKYDDICLLHLPRLKMRIDMDWVCNGDPFDHWSIVPCAPNKLPQYTQNKEHDSFRAFRSRALNIQWHIDVKPSAEHEHTKPSQQTSDSTPQVLLYSNTLRWLNSLTQTLSMKNRPICRGRLFNVPRVKRTQLTRHFKQMNINVALPRFIISCWMSFSSNYGFRVHSSGLQLSSAMHLTSTTAAGTSDTAKLTASASSAHVAHGATDSPPLKRRSQLQWSVDHMTAELADSQITLFGDVKNTRESENADKTFGSMHQPHESFFMGLNRLSYARESPQLASPKQCDTRALHRLTVRDLRAAFTANNRDTCLAMFDGLQKSRILSRNLSTDALKMFEFIDEQTNKAMPPAAQQQQHASLSRSQSGHSPVRTRGQSIDGSDMLHRLIQEHDTKFIAYSETVTHEPVESLNGVALCTQDDVQQTRWHIELINSQMCLKGSETGGMVLCTAARASVHQRIHAAVWRDAQLLGKSSWTATLSGMQYYAPLFGNAYGKKSARRRTGDAAGATDLHWLPTELVDQPAAPQSHTDLTLNDTVDSFMAHSQVVGGVLPGGDETSWSDSMSAELQLQRVISRCACQLYFCSFNDTLDFDEGTPQVQPQVEESGSWSPRPGIGLRVENVDTFTLKHNMLEVSTNAQQYEMILDIINHLLLFVDPKKKESAEKLRHLRFELQSQSPDQMRPLILTLQNEVRQLLTEVRHLEKRIFFNDRRRDVEGETEELEEELRQLEALMNARKNSLSEKSEKLARHISCFKEKQLLAEKRRLPVSEDQAAAIARRFEVCFEDCTWRLTDKDGQIGIAQLLIRNFLYTRVSRINNSGEHLLEIGTVKVTNLLPNSKYRDVLQAQQYGMEEGQKLRQCVRVVCRDMAPVGGISVKEHFEINVSPMTVQMTYGFFRAIMRYFFPDKNIDKADQQLLDMTDEDKQQMAVAASSSSSAAAAEKMNKITVTPKTEKKQKRSKKNSTPAAQSDEIEKMKERSEKNIMFLYIKIPEVPFTVSYRGSKEKNIEDVENFNLMFPLVEYHDRNWTWLDLALAIKQRCKRVLLQQFMKQKLLRNRKGGAQAGETQLSEEEKKRLVLGNIVVGSEKSSKAHSHGLTK